MHHSSLFPKGTDQSSYFLHVSLAGQWIGLRDLWIEDGNLIQSTRKSVAVVFGKQEIGRAGARVIIGDEACGHNRGGCVPAEATNEFCGLQVCREMLEPAPAVIIVNGSEIDVSVGSNDG